MCIKVKLKERFKYLNILIMESFYRKMLLFLPFTNEIANLLRTQFELPIWVYNPDPVKILDIITKMLIDSLSLFGVLINTLEEGIKSCNIFVMTILGLTLTLFSFMIPTIFLPLILDLNNKYKIYLGFLFIFILYLIDHYAILIAEKYQHKINKEIKNKEEETLYKERTIYYYIAFVISLLPILYLSHYSLTNQKEYLAIGFFVLILSSIIFIEKSLLSQDDNKDNEENNSN